MSVTEYTPYGELAAASTLPSSGFGFTGQRYEASAGLYYYHARYYDPALGCFLSPDPFVQAPGDPQTLNRYAYVRNNPVRYVDPSGYDFGLSFLLFLLFVAIVAWNVVEASHQQEQHGGPSSDDRAFRGTWETRFNQPGAPTLGGSFASPLRPDYPGLGTGQGGISAASDLPLEPSWGPDDVIFLLVGLGVAAKAAVVAARELGPTVLFSLRSLGDAGAIRISGTSAGLEAEQAENALFRIRHFTNRAGKGAIERSGFLRRHTWVTTPRSMPRGFTPQQAENLLELDPGRGKYFVDLTVKKSDLYIPKAGPRTSGGRFQLRLRKNIPVDPSDFQTYGQ